jgi:RNA polymerase sigma-70 factor (ECF subfamily)
MMKSDLDNTSDKSLIQAIQAGEEQSLNALYQRYADGLFAFIACRINIARDAEDIWQETWLAAFRRLTQFRAESQFFTWLCAIARHKIADYYRKHPQENFDSASNPLANARLMIDQQLLPEEVLSHQQVQAQVLTCLFEIEPIYSSALLARYVDQQPVSAVAEKLGKSYKATESILSRARKAFQDRFCNQEKGKP